MGLETGKAAAGGNLPADSAGWLELAKFLKDRLHNRQSYEWKITLGFWAALVASSWKEGSFSAATISAGWWAVAWLAFAFFWLRGVWVANENDKSRVEEIFAHATGKKIGEYDDPERISMSDQRFWFGFCGNWSGQFQALATLGIMLAISKGKNRTVLCLPGSLRDFWWGESFALTWAVVLGVGTVLWVLASWLASGSGGSGE